MTINMVPLTSNCLLCHIDREDRSLPLLMLTMLMESSRTTSMDSRPVLDVIVFSPGILVLDSCALMNWSFLSRYGWRDEILAKGGGTSRLAELRSQFEAALRKDQCLNCSMLSHSSLKLLKQAQRRAVAVSTPQPITTQRHRTCAS